MKRRILRLWFPFPILCVIDAPAPCFQLIRSDNSVIYASTTSEDKMVHLMVVANPFDLLLPINSLVEVQCFLRHNCSFH